MVEGYDREAAEQAARFNRWNVSIEPCLDTKVGGKSAGTAVGTKSFIGMSITEAVKESQHLHPKGQILYATGGCDGQRRGTLRVHIHIRWSWHLCQVQSRFLRRGGPHHLKSSWHMVHWG